MKPAYTATAITADPQRGAARALAARGDVMLRMEARVHRQGSTAAQCVMSPWARSPSRITGGVLKVWCGAGLGTVHSRPSRHSQARASACSPLRSERHRMKPIRNGVANMPNAPIELTRFQSANTTL